MSIAARMKWASQRKTTRVEDLAYSLMGLFDVNMPLLYGEGNKAFVRLQEEILKGSDDHTIFLWTNKATVTPHVHLCGLLAEDPADFASAGNYRPLPPALSRGSTAWTATNHGLRVALFLQPVVSENGQAVEDEYDAVLECAKRQGDGWSESPAIRVRRLYGDQFARVDPQVIKVVTTPSYDQDIGSGSYEVIFVKQKPVYAVPDFMVSFDNIRQQETTSKSSSIYVTGVWPEKYWDAETATLRSIPSETDRAVGLFRFHDAELYVDVDCAVGLRRSPGGAWGFWTLLRRSDNGLLYKAAGSANFFLATSHGQAPDGVPQLHEAPDPHAWHMNEERVDRIIISIRDAYIHGRRYLFVRASPAMELPARPAEYKDKQEAPVLPKALTPVDDNLTPLDSRLKSLLMEVTVSTSLRCGYLAAEPPSPSRIRTPSLVSVLEEFEKIVNDRPIEGDSPEATKILQACKEGETSELADLDTNDPRLESVTTDLFGLRPLHWAIIGGHLPVVETLLRRGADLCSGTTQGWLPFHLAALFGRFTILNWLVYDAINKSLQPWAEGGI